MGTDLSKKCKKLLDSSLRPSPQELNEIDWKLQLTDDSKKFIKHLSAFSNYPEGGFIVFGINDSNGEIVGVAAQESKDISDKLSNLARSSLSPKISINPFTFDYKGKNLLGIFISESTDKPVHTFKNKSVGTAFIRAGGTTRAMSRDEIRTAYMTTRPLRYEEMPAALPAEIEANWKDYFDFSEVIKRLNAGPFTSNENLYEFLQNNKLLTLRGDSLVPTNLAVITCAKNFGSIPNCEKYGVRLIEYKSDNKLEAIRDEDFNSGYTLILDNLLKRIIDILPHSEIIEQATRVNRPIIPEIALRETIANAIIHRNFISNESCIYVEIYSNRVEITNPGGLLPGITIDRIIDHPSKTRNEVLADFMRKLRFAEERGSGIDKAVFACEFYGLPALTFIDTEDYFRIILHTPKKFSDMSKEERVDAVYQHACLNHVISKKTSNTSIRKRFGFGEEKNTKVYRLITEAIDQQRIKLANPSDAKKNYHYIPYWL